MLPLDLSHLSPTALWLVDLAIGFGFGAVLEASGFGDSRKLAAQFYGRDVTVLKVMFGAIITAGTLVFLFSALQWLDFPRVYVNETYLAPQIVGGLIMGVGFIVGGFCPGTSLVATATLKVDGMVFLLGVASGEFLFGETLPSFEGFFESSHLGRFTVADWLHIDLGWAMTGVVVMALLMFWGGEIAEALFGRGEKWAALKLWRHDKKKLAAAGGLLALALLSAFIGQPDAAARWKAIAPTAQPLLDSRAVDVHPGEVNELKQNAALYVSILDVRDESDFNLFHLKGALHAPLAQLDDPEFLRLLSLRPTNTVTFVVGNGEAAATLAWKHLDANGIPNLYILEGGLNRWLDLYPPEACLALPGPAPKDEDQSRWTWLAAVGERSWSAHPDCGCNSDDILCPGQTVAPKRELPELKFDHKVKVSVKAAKHGGCG